MVKGLLFYTLGVILIAIIIGCVYLLTWSPRPEWNPSPDTHLIFTQVTMSYIDYNYIPDVQVWGDGHIIWVEYTPARSRKVLEGYFSSNELKQLINMFIKTGFFRFQFGRSYICDYRSYGHGDTLRINLVQTESSTLMSSADEETCSLIIFLYTGAGVKGIEFIPTKGKLHVLPIELTDIPANTIAQQSWPDEEFGYNLEDVYQMGDREITGDELNLAWEIVNSNPGWSRRNAVTGYIRIE